MDSKTENRHQKVVKVLVVCVHCQTDVGLHHWNETKSGPAPVNYPGHCSNHYKNLWDAHAAPFWLCTAEPSCSPGDHGAFEEEEEDLLPLL